jgi:hypothetical protein
MNYLEAPTQSPLLQALGIVPPPAISDAAAAVAAGDAHPVKKKPVHVRQIIIYDQSK